MNFKFLFAASVEGHITSFHLPFIEMLQKMGGEAHVAAKAGKKTDEDEIEKQGVKFHDTDFSRNPFAASNIKALWQLIKLMRKEKFSLVHLHTPTAAFIGRLAAMLTGTRPVIYTVHGFHFYRGAPLINRVVYAAAEKLAALWTDCLITMNDEDYAYAKKMRLRKNGFVNFVHGVGVPISRYDKYERARREETRRNLGLDVGSTLILTVGELIERKNHIQAIKSMEIVLTQNGKVYLCIAGSGVLKEKLEEVIINNGLAANVRLLGYRRDIPELLQASDIFILTSVQEGLPRCVMEAMAAGKPIIATDIRGNRELVENCINGYLIPVHKVPETAETMLRLINSTELRESFGGRSLKIIKNYSVENVIGEMEYIYNRLLPDINC